MSKIESVENPAIKPKVKTYKDARNKVLSQIREESQVVVHCTYAGNTADYLIRIWNSTFLFPYESKHVSKLVHCENITLYPTWMQVAAGRSITFTLIFTALPKSCKRFDMIEKIPESGGFECRNIYRNNSDVYHIDLK
jgi:hypothetical protein